MGQLTVDANRCNRVLNPYPTHMPEHYSWCVEQFPFLNGLIVANVLNNGFTIDCSESIITVDRGDEVDKTALIEEIKNLMSLGSITVNDLL
jgi:hypothetical protein